jgi:hypothetical protein
MMELFLSLGCLLGCGSLLGGSVLSLGTTNTLTTGLGSLFQLLVTLSVLVVDLLNLALLETFLDGLANGSQDDVD